jgi:hypothetical protein
MREGRNVRMKKIVFVVFLSLVSVWVSSCTSSYNYSAQELKDKISTHLTFPINDNKLVSALKINNISSVSISKKENKIYLDFSADIRAMTTNFSCSHFIYSCEPVLENSEAYLRNFKLESTDCSTPIPKFLEKIVADVIFKSFDDMKFRSLGDVPPIIKKFYINDENRLVLE